MKLKNILIIQILLFAILQSGIVLTENEDIQVQGDIISQSDEEETVYMFATQSESMPYTYMEISLKM